MYAWGGDTINWRGRRTYDYGSARAKYDKAAADADIGTRTYSINREPNMDLVDPKGKTIKSDSKNPVIVAIDVTGSMSSWPGEIFDRLPLLYQTLGKYRGDLDLSFAAIGDAHCDSYPLQITDFTNNIKDLETRVKALGCEGGGGGHIRESYELFGYFMNKHCETKNATSPFLIIYGDEGFYNKVNPRQVEHYIGDELQAEIDSKNVWNLLMNKFNLYFLQKPYGSGCSDGTTEEVKKIWAGALGRQRIIDLPSEERAVDVAMGLIAKYWGEYQDFGKSLDARHDSSALKASVHNSLRFIDGKSATNSVMSRKSKSKLTKNLLPGK